MMGTHITIAACQGAQRRGAIRITPVVCQGVQRWETIHIIPVVCQDVHRPENTAMEETMGAIISLVMETVIIERQML